MDFKSMHVLVCTNIVRKHEGVKASDKKSSFVSRIRTEVTI